MTAELIAGPYLPPACQAGDWIEDEVGGLVEVGGWTTAPISWPRRKKTGKPSLILTAELARAVRAESSEAIQHWWGVGEVTVWKWRKALGVGRVTDGTRKLLQERTGVPEEAAARGRASAATPEARARMSAAKRGKPVHPNTLKALLAAASRRKPAGWGVRANAKMLGRELPPLTHRADWSQQDDEQLVQMYRRRPVADIALLIGRTQGAIVGRARKLGLMREKAQTLWTQADDDYLREHYQALGLRECSSRLGRTASAIYARAKHLGLAQVREAARGKRPSGAAAWSPAEDAVLRSLWGVMRNEEIASQLKRSLRAVTARAVRIGLKR